MRRLKWGIALAVLTLAALTWLLWRGGSTEPEHAAEWTGLEAPDGGALARVGPDGGEATHPPAPSTLVRGHVTDEADRGVPAEVTASSAGVVIARVTARDDGAFGFDQLPAGDYTFAARTKDGAGPLVHRALAGGLATMVLKVFRGTQVAGHVLDPDGKPVFAARVSFEATDGGVPMVLSDHEGAFVLGALARGPHTWSVSHDAWLNATGHVEVPEEELVIRLERGASVSGSFVDEEDRPLAGEVTAERRPDLEQRLGRAKGDGRFVVQGLKPGHYRVTAVAEDGAVVAAETELAPRAEAELTLKLERGAEISGVVVSPSGVPQPGVRVSAETALSVRRVTATSDGAGAFTLKHLKAGAGYRLFVRTETDAFQDERKPVKAPASGIRLVTRPQSHLKGRVVDARGAPIVHFTVNDQTQTSAEGRFDIVDLVDPDRAIEINAPGFAPYQTRIALLAEGVDLGDIVLQGGRDVVVTVVDSAGKPVAGARVWNSHGPDVDDTGDDVVVTDARGRATVRHLASEATLYASHQSDAPAQALVSDEQTEVTLTLLPGATLSGVVRNVDGATWSSGGLLDAVRVQGPDFRSEAIAADGSYSFGDLTAGTWRVVFEAGGHRAVGAAVVRAGAAVKLDLQLTENVPLTLRLRPAPAKAEFLQLLPGDLTAAETTEELAVALGSTTVLTASGDGEWSTPAASPGVATLFMRDPGADPLRVSLTLINVPAAGGTVDATPAAPRVLRTTGAH